MPLHSFCASSLSDLIFVCMAQLSLLIYFVGTWASIWTV